MHCNGVFIIFFYFPYFLIHIQNGFFFQIIFFSFFEKKGKMFYSCEVKDGKNVAALSIHPFLNLSEEEMKQEYLSYMDAAQALHQQTGTKVTEVIDLQGITLSQALPNIALLVRILSLGESYDHAHKTILRNPPYGTYHIFETVVSLLPWVSAQKVEIC